MSQLPDYFREHLNKTLLGRIKLKIFQQISGGNNENMPTDQMVRHFIAENYRLNAEVGTLLLKLLSTTSCGITSYDQLQKPDNLIKVLSKLDENPLEKPLFFEVTGCPENLPNTIGAFVYCEELREGGYVYVVTLLEDKEFPDHIAGRAEIRSSQVAPEPAFGILELGGYVSYSLDEYQNNSLGIFLTKILEYVNKHRETNLIPLSQLKQHNLYEPPALKPPTDRRLLMLLQLVKLQKVNCVEAEVELSLIKPYDLDFCLSYPMDVIDELAQRIKNGSLSKLLVYWNDGMFIMSDDYGHYLAYRKIGYKEIPIVAMGPFPEEIIKPTKIGGIELIPPVVISSNKGFSTFSSEIKNFILESRLRTKSLSKEIGNLYALFMILSRLIQDPNTKEKELHKFILENPITIDSHGFHLESEVKLGDKYRVDLAISYSFVDRQVLLIELEKANIPIFTKSGRHRAEVTHAIQQVEDWLRWWRENPLKIPELFDGTLPIEGLVVIGRNVNLDEDARRRLLNLNQNRKIKVITYDDLLERLMNLIKLLEGKNEE